MGGKTGVWATKIVDTTLEIHTGGVSDVADVTPHIRDVVRSSGLPRGIIHLFATGSTCALTTLEYEPGLVVDLKAALERLIPGGTGYAHGKAWGEDNGHSHLRASLIGPSLTLPLLEGEAKLGPWPQVVLVEMDTRARTREIVVQIIGEPA